MNNKLNNHRKQIDKIDTSLINLLAKRMKVVQKIGQYKKTKNLPSLDAVRWQQVLNSRTKKAKLLGLNSEFIKKIYELIHNYALKVEKSLIE